MEQQNQQPMQEETYNKPQIKTNWKHVTIVAVFGLTAVGSILLLKAMQPAAPVTQTPPSDHSTLNNQQSAINTSGWQTYRNEEFGFEVRYPRDWYLVWRNGSVLELLNEQRSSVGTGSENMVIFQLIASKEVTSINLFEGLKNAKVGIPYEKDLVVYTKIENLMIGVAPAVRYKADRKAIPYIGLPISEEVLFRKGNSTFQVLFLGFSDSALSQNKDLMAQILSTFRFVE